MEDPHNLQQFDPNFIKQLLETKENEILDFKSDFYNVNDENEQTRIKARRDLIKDLNSLLNVKDKILHNNEESYLFIGIGEENDSYNGHHKNLKINNELRQTFYQLIKNHINPHPVVTIIDLFISGDKENIELSFTQKDGFDNVFLIVIKHKIGEIYEIKKNIQDLKEGQTFTRSGADNIVLLESEKNNIRKFKKNPKYQIKFTRIRVIMMVLCFLTFIFENFYIKISFEYNGIPGVIIKYYNIFGIISKEFHYSQMNLSNFSNSLKFLEEIQLILAIMFIVIIFLYMMNVRISLNVFEFPTKKFIDVVFFVFYLSVLSSYLLIFYNGGFLIYKEMLNTPGYTNVEFLILPQSSFYILITIFIFSIVDIKTQDKNWNILYLKNIY